MALLADIKHNGPQAHSWPNYSKLGKAPGIPNDAFHCHIKRGRPTYVACWSIINEKKREIELFYVGTHEKAPY